MKRAMLVVFAAFLLSLFHGKLLGAEIVPPKILTLSPTGVNLSDGSLTMKNSDISIGEISLDRFYMGGLSDGRSTLAMPWFGRRMTHSFDIYVKRKFNKQLNIPETNRPLVAAYYSPIV